MKLPTETQYRQAVETLGALRFFPSDPGGRTGVMYVLQSMVEDVERLDWIVRTMLTKVGEWKGPLDLRGIYCTRFKPADGEEAVTSTPGFSAEDLEAQSTYEYKQLASQPRSGRGLISASQIKIPGGKP